MYNFDVMLRIINLVFYILVVPFTFGLVYNSILGAKEYVMLEIWSKGWAFMLAFFSLIYWLCSVFGVEWHEDIWEVLSLAVTFLAIAAMAIAIINRKRKGISNKLSLVRGDLFPVYIMVIILFVLSIVLLRTPDYDHHMEQYIRVYNAETIGSGTDMTEDMLVELKDTLFTCDTYVLYLSVNKLIKMAADKFLTVIMAFPMLLLSITCYDFIGERLNVDRKRRYVFLMLIYAVYIVTVFCAEYHLYAIYNYLWEPVTAYATIFLPFQLGMMMYVEEMIVRWSTPWEEFTKPLKPKGSNEPDVFFSKGIYPGDKHRLSTCVIWTVAVFFIGYMFPWKEWLIILAPEMAGVTIGIVRRMIKGGTRNGSIS